jgi:hypothetical protein
MNYLARATAIWQIPVNLSEQPLDKEWKGTPAHLGPHRYTPLRKSLEFKRSAALLSLLGGSMVWGYQRLRNMTDASILVHLAEALFCYQIDPLYLNPVESHRYFPRTDGGALPDSAVKVYPWIFFQRFFSFPKFWPIYPQIIETAQAIYLTEHIMPKEDRSFASWTKGAIKALDLAAPFPDSRTEPIPPGTPLEVFEAESQRAIGMALGPSALLPNRPFDASANAAEVAELLAAAAASRNPFLRSTKAMKSEGFVGDPYVVAR